MKRTIYIPFLIAAFCLLCVSCAKDKNETNEETAKRILNSWLLTNGYGDIQPTDAGIYNLSEEEGTGDVLPDSVYAFVNYVTTSMDGSYKTYNTEDVAIQLGTWSRTGRYTPRVWYMPYQGIGVRDMMIGQEAGDTRVGGMRAGGKRRSVIVPWVVDPSTGKTVSYSDYTSIIYNVEVVDYTSDITTYQVEKIEDFMDRNAWTYRDSLYYGLYVEQTRTDPEKDTLPDGTTIYLWYIGKYLDGQVFDTNIKDTARYYGIYNENNSYTSSSITFYRDSSTIMENSSFVKGFTLAINQMRYYGDRCHTAFISDWGYGTTDSGNIPAYTPLYFDIWIEDED